MRSADVTIPTMQSGWGDANELLQVGRLGWRATTDEPKSAPSAVLPISCG